jgi:hypothetical protein
MCDSCGDDWGNSAELVLSQIAVQFDWDDLAQTAIALGGNDGTL